MKGNLRCTECPRRLSGSSAIGVALASAESAPMAWDDSRFLGPRGVGLVRGGWLSACSNGSAECSTLDNLAVADELVI